METTDTIKQEMARWSAEVKDRYHFEMKVNAFLKNEVLRLESEVLRLRNENTELKNRIDNICSPKSETPRTGHDLEID